MSELLEIHKYCGLFSFATLVVGIFIGMAYKDEQVIDAGFVETPRGDIYKQILKVEKERSIK